MRKTLIIIAILFAALSVQSAQATVLLPPPDPAPLPSNLWCTTFRHQYGAESAWQTAQALNYPCHHNWISDSFGVPNHYPTVYSMTGTQQKHVDRANKSGGLWFVGSEPNLAVTKVTPSEAAAFIEHWTQATDVTWACCGAIASSRYPQLIEWMTPVFDKYDAPRPDALHFHIYFIGGIGEWLATVNQIRAWMAANDMADLPLYITETAATNTHDAGSLMIGIREAVCSGLVDGTFWYIGDEEYHGHWGWNELSVKGELTDLGWLFLSLNGCPESEPEGEGEPVCDDCTPETEQPTAADEIAQPANQWRVYAPVMR